MTPGFRLGAHLAAGLLAATVPAAAGAACNVSAQGVAFGFYNPLSLAGLNGVGNVRVQCTLLTGFNVSIGPGSGTVADRRMNGGASQLRYNLFKDVDRLFIWGENNDGLGTIGTTVDLPVYGRIPALQNVPANIYLDSIVVTITY